MVARDNGQEKWISFCLFLINKSWYVRKDTGSFLPPYMGQEVSKKKSLLDRWFVICGTVCDVGR